MLRHVKPTILVVDDQADIRLALRLSLEMIGYDVVLASDDREAMAAVDNGRPDLVLLDVTLPAISGWDLLEKLRADERFGTLPIVITSALPADQVAAHARRLGATDHLAKPFLIEVLAETVRRALDEAERS
jgi:CheY-like chemotaxis protein